MGLSSKAPITRTALIYVTSGTLLVVWTLIWYLYLRNNPPETNGVWYWVYGLLLTGISFIVIGLGVGGIGRTAQPTDPPRGVSADVPDQPDVVPTQVTTNMVDQRGLLVPGATVSRNT